VFELVRAPRVVELSALLVNIITPLSQLLMRQGYLVEGRGMRHLVEPDADDADHGLRAPQAVSCESFDSC
jgi:hypothetical protein